MPGLVPAWIVSGPAVATVVVVMLNLGQELNSRDFMHAWGLAVTATILTSLVVSS